MQATAYLHFNGNCEAALKFYAARLGGKIEAMMPYEGTPAADQMPAERQKDVLHARIAIGNMSLMASDAPPGRYTPPQGFSLTLGVDGAAEAERLFSALADGGTVSMPIGETFFAHRFGMLTDRFGVPWMVLCERAPVT